MFDVSFSEIIVIAVVALIVIGPEKLPKVARTLGMLTGRMQRYVTSIKADIDRELRMDELRKMEQESRNSIMSVQADISAEVSKTEAEVKTALDATKPSDPA
jgi:sec-independent protein translocase protein TatB